MRNSSNSTGIANQYLSIAKQCSYWLAVTAINC